MNIVIKLPEGIKEKILSFPFLHALKNYYSQILEEEETLNLHLISVESEVELLNLLPFKAYYHTISESDLKNVFTIHRGVKALNINNVDVFISLTPKLVDTMIGKSLKAVKKIGFESKKNNFFLTDRIIHKDHGHICERFYALSQVFENKWPAIKKVAARELSPIYKDWQSSPYVMINIDTDKEGLNLEWIDFFDLFQDCVFVLSVDNVKTNFQKALLTEYIKQLPEKNTYKILEVESYIEYSKALAFSSCFVSSDSDLVTLASYIGAQSFLINHSTTRDFDNRYFLGDTVECDSSSSYYKDGDSFHWGKFFDEIHSFLISVNFTGENK